MPMHIPRTAMNTTARLTAKPKLRRKNSDPNRKVQRLAVTLPDGVEQQILDMMPESCFKAKADQHMGAPTAYEPRVVRTFLQHLVRGMPTSDAAVMAGVSASTVHGWAERHPDFTNAIACAKALCVDQKLQIIESVRDERERVRAAQWVLERRFPQDWAPVKNVQVRSDGFDASWLRRLSEARLA